MPTLYFVQHTDFPEERDQAFLSEEEANKYLESSQQTLSGEVWLRKYEYDLSEEGVKDLAMLIGEEYVNNLK